MKEKKKKKKEFKRDGLEVQQQALKTTNKKNQKTKYIKKVSYI